jgi:hypothetical protein
LTTPLPRLKASKRVVLARVLLKVFSNLSGSVPESEPVCTAGSLAEKNLNETAQFCILLGARSQYPHRGRHNLGLTFLIGKGPEMNSHLATASSERTRIEQAICGNDRSLFKIDRDRLRLAVRLEEYKLIRRLLGSRPHNSRSRSGNNDPYGRSRAVRGHFKVLSKVALAIFSVGPVAAQVLDNVPLG